MERLELGRKWSGEAKYSGLGKDNPFGEKNKIGDGLVTQAVQSGVQDPW